MKPKRHNCDIYRVTGHCGVYLRDSDAPGYDPRRKPRVCYAKRTLKWIGQRYGEGHLALVLRLIVETEGNADQLYEDTLLALSGLLAAYPGLCDRGTALFDQFDKIDLKNVRWQARRLVKLATGMKAHHVMQVLLAMRLGCIE